MKLLVDSDDLTPLDPDEPLGVPVTGPDPPWWLAPLNALALTVLLGAVGYVAGIVLERYTTPDPPPADEDPDAAPAHWFPCDECDQFTPGSDLEAIPATAASRGDVTAADTAFFVAVCSPCRSALGHPDDPIN